jgi:hypothetical protein
LKDRSPVIFLNSFYLFYLISETKSRNMSRGKYWVTEPDQEATLNMNVPGYGAKPARTVHQVLLETVNKFGNEKAMALKRPVKVSCSEVS